MIVASPLPPVLEWCNGPYRARRPLAEPLRVARGEKPPVRYVVKDTSPSLIKYLPGIYDAFREFRRVGEDVMFRMQIPVEVRGPMEQLGIELHPKSEIELCSCLILQYETPCFPWREDGQVIPSPYSRGNVLTNFYPTDERPPVDQSRPRAFVNFYIDPNPAHRYRSIPTDDPFPPKDEFTLLKDIVFYVAKASVLKILTGRPDPYDGLDRSTLPDNHPAHIVDGYSPLDGGSDIYADDVVRRVVGILQRQGLWGQN